MQLQAIERCLAASSLSKHIGELQSLSVYDNFQQAADKNFLYSFFFFAFYWDEYSVFVVYQVTSVYKCKTCFQAFLL